MDSIIYTYFMYLLYVFYDNHGNNYNKKRPNFILRIQIIMNLK